jgi:hypothetical protein
VRKKESTSQSPAARKSAPRKRNTAKAEAAADGRAGAAQSNGVSPEQRHAMIAERAYLRAEKRGFANGDPLTDWLEGEREVDRLLGQHHA